MLQVSGYVTIRKEAAYYEVLWHMQNKHDILRKEMVSMTYVRSMFSLFLLFFLTNAHAGELPVLTLDEGENTIALSIVNNWNNDLADVTVEVDRGKLPSWLSFQGTPQAVDVRSGAKGNEKLYLNLDVIDAPFGAEAQVPFTLIDVSGNIWNYTASVRVSAGTPLQYALHANYPNPFNPSTTIGYSLIDAQHTKLTVFNALGQTIRTIVNEPQTAGIHTVQWDGRNVLGEQVSSGVYFYRLETGTFVKTKRMMLIE